MEIIFKNTNKNKKETSKIVIGSLIILTYLFVIFVCVMICIFKDLSPLTFLIPSFFGLSSVAVGFYSWKAKAENKIKLEIARIEAEEKLKNKYKSDKIKINTNDITDFIEDGKG